LSGFRESVTHLRYTVEAVDTAASLEDLLMAVSYSRTYHQQVDKLSIRWCLVPTIAARGGATIYAE
jgi:hypothetical protein